jgi:hypothetical protein
MRDKPNITELYWKWPKSTMRKAGLRSKDRRAALYEVVSTVSKTDDLTRAPTWVRRDRLACHVLVNQRRAGMNIRVSSTSTVALI